MFDLYKGVKDMNKNEVNFIEFLMHVHKQLVDANQIEQPINHDLECHDMEVLINLQEQIARTIIYQLKMLATIDRQFQMLDHQMSDFEKGGDENEVSEE